MDFADYEVAPLTPDILTTYYDNRTAESQHILDELLDVHNIEPGLPSALGTWGRGSHAHGCQRSNALENLDVPRDYPHSGASMLTFAIGTHIHAVVQAAWHTALHPDEPCTGTVACPHGVQLEATVDNRPKGYDHSGHVDILWTPDRDTTEAVEIKSVSDYGYRLAIGKQMWGKKVAHGPKHEHVAQAGEYAYGAGADQVRLIYINKGKHDSITEWVIPIEDVMPLVVADLEQQEETRELVQDKGMLPPRWQVEHGYIDDVPQHVSVTGKWGDPFFCSGCAWNDLCPTLPTAAVPLGAAGIEVPS